MPPCPDSRFQADHRTQVESSMALEECPRVYSASMSQWSTLWAKVAQKRYFICLLCFLATCAAYIERTGFSVAFTAMCREADVSERVKGVVMGAFYWGYGSSQIPGGFLAQRYGGRRMLLISFAGWSTFVYLTPRDAKQATMIAMVRVLVGIFQGFLIPAVHTVLSEWVLPHERAKATSLCTSGMYLGSAAAIQYLPYAAHVAGDPAVIFKIVSALGGVWLALWAVYGQDVRHRSSLIPLTSQQAVNGTHQTDVSKSIAPTPWSQLLRHSAVWAIVLNNFTFHYSFYVVMNWMPTYFASLIGTDLESIGVGKPMPYLLMFAMSNVGGWMGDWLIDSGHSVGSARKLVNSIGFCTTAALLLAMPAASSVFQGLIVLSLCLGACGFTRGGFSVNHMDIAPRYAGIVMGISNTAGTVSGIIGVSATGFILEAAGGSEFRVGWYQAHLLAACMGVAGSFYFIVFGKGQKLFS